jgi:hypothetical protein
MLYLSSNNKNNMSNKQQTAVEELAIALYEGGFLQGDGDKIQDLVDKAKEMERERMIAFTNKYINEELWVNCNTIESDSTIEQYYEKTYGGNK